MTTDTTPGTSPRTSASRIPGRATRVGDPSLGRPRHRRGDTGGGTGEPVQRDGEQRRTAAVDGHPGPLDLDAGGAGHLEGDRAGVVLGGQVGGRLGQDGLGHLVRERLASQAAVPSIVEMRVDRNS